MIYRTKGGTEFDVQDGQTYVRRDGRTLAVVPIDDLEEFLELYFTASSSQAFLGPYPPEGFEPADYAVWLPRHHRTFAPWTLKSTANAVWRYHVMCPLCRLQTTGPTIDDAATKWRLLIGGSPPPAAAADKWIVESESVDVTPHHVGYPVRMLKTKSAYDGHTLQCTKPGCGFSVLGISPDDAVEAWKREVITPITEGCNS